MIFLNFNLLSTQLKDTKNLAINHSVLRHKDLTLLNFKIFDFLVP